MTAYAACRSCGTQVMWARIARSGRMMPLDIDPVENGNTELTGIYEPTGVPHVTVLERAGVERARADRRLLYRSHFVTCPNAKAHRK